MALGGGSNGSGGPSESSKDKGMRRSYIGSSMSFCAVHSCGAARLSPLPPMSCSILCISPKRGAALLSLGGATPTELGAPKSDDIVGRGWRGGEAGRCSYRGSAPPLSGWLLRNRSWLAFSSTPTVAMLSGLWFLEDVLALVLALVGCRPLEDERSELALETREEGWCKDRLSGVDMESDLP